MTGPHAFSQKHLLGMEHLSAEEITTILDLGENFLEIANRPIKKVPTLRGKTVINLFLEPSTRTRTSFEIAAKRLSADGINFTAAASSTTKGETLIDTATNLDAMSPDIVVIRHAQAGAAYLLTKHIKAAIVNAGDGQHEHPTQALLDASTIRAHKGKIEGLTVVICGDIDHSRVARSNIFALRKLGATSAWPGRARFCPLASKAWAWRPSTASSRPWKARMW
jgi:aspartate carbamoyltransferase catalytic subunit